MGWFDKKSWQLRKKIRDLQSDLAVAERNGQYVVEQGLFFAELQEMGDRTMIILGAADQLDAEEEDVIRNFFERNGFSVEHVRLDKAHKTLADVEIIPPEEFTRRVARDLHAKGYRILDDSENERPSDLEKKAITLSTLVRTISALFAGHVHQIIISTPIKLNMEGNRLLHWMPRIRETLEAKIPGGIASVYLNPFIEAYNHYYGRFGTLETAEALQALTEQTEVRDVSAEMQFEQPNASKTEVTPALGLSRWNGVSADKDTNVPIDANDSSPTAAAGSDKPTESARDAHAARTLAHMYRSLIGASNQRKVRNCEMLLDDIARFFGTRSTCLLIKEGAEGSLKLHANVGLTSCVETTEQGVVSCESEILSTALSTSTMAVSPGNGNGNTNSEAVAVPISLGSGQSAVLYLREPASFTSNSNDSQYMDEFSKIFKEFPDLLF